MSAVVVGVVGTLMGVLIGGVLQQVQASRSRRWQREDSLSDAKRAVYAEFLRSISASYGQAVSGQRTRSEDANLHAAVAEIEILTDQDVSEPARDLVKAVIDAHTRIATGADETALVAGVDRRRHEVIALFKSDLGLEAPSGRRTP
ncbi:MULTISPECIES: hypothetical protein [Streptomyces]|uniref:hypothetical protein n=1 Tax=Streptomyces TaxID=1883 RepID=UPI00099B5FDC|nr:MULTISPECIES: hypothetical protein [Streptomyces]MBP5909109.1 hypothetical protein [Streptomyces sp. LBUM 1478]MBP5928038.1 hypothetical protein [Streptomyces sp. LBUM 1479]MDX2551637.1 hypothetical protein [Streptomyces stelliscabiei]MDX2636019.1 hypothetical protein [Streptomyces stelliscabiei]MDX2805634.1 hypothetical protein [Streptomyces scabiei]